MRLFLLLVLEAFLEGMIDEEGAFGAAECEGDAEEV